MSALTAERLSIEHDLDRFCDDPERLLEVGDGESMEHYGAAVELGLRQLLLRASGLDDVQVIPTFLHEDFDVFWSGYGRPLRASYNSTQYSATDVVKMMLEMTRAVRLAS